MSGAGARTNTARVQSVTVVRLLVAFALGCTASLSLNVFGIPGNGEFVAVIWSAAFVALLIAPGRSGFITLMVGATLSAAIVDISDGTFGLIFLIVVVVAALAGHGALSASVLRRWWTRGWNAGLGDSRVLGGAGAALALLALFALVANDFARNPP